MLTDLELTDLIKSGDQRAFTIIYDRYWRLLYGHIFKMLRDEEDSKDILQEVFSNLWLNSEKIPVITNLAGYLYTATRNRVLNAIRKNKYQSDYLESLARYHTEASDETIQNIECRDLTIIIDKEIASLPPRMRQVFDLSRKENLSNKEIGKLLGISEETVKKQIQNSLRTIRFNLKRISATMLMLFFVY